MGGNVPRGHISADYFGVFADRIQELLKADRQHHDWISLKSPHEELTLQMRKPDREMIERAEWVFRFHFAMDTLALS